MLPLKKQRIRELKSVLKGSQLIGGVAHVGVGGTTPPAVSQSLEILMGFVFAGA